MSSFLGDGFNYDVHLSDGIMSPLPLKVSKRARVAHHPVTFRSKHSFVGLPQLKAYSTTNIHFQLKTTETSGLLLYNGGKGQDFIAVELVGGRLHYVFNLGDGARSLRSNLTVNDNRWHVVTIGRPSLRQHSLTIDDSVGTITSTGSNVHLDLDGILYFGGVRRNMYRHLPKAIKSRHGYEGCIASLDFNGATIDPAGSEHVIIPSSLVARGCDGAATKCSDAACANGGTCVQLWHSFTCDCDMTSFTGPTCADGKPYVR